MYVCICVHENLCVNILPNILRHCPTKHGPQSINSLMPNTKESRMQNWEKREETKVLWDMLEACLWGTIGIYRIRFLSLDFFSLSALDNMHCSSFISLSSSLYFLWSSFLTLISFPQNYFLLSPIGLYSTFYFLPSFHFLKFYYFYQQFPLLSPLSFTVTYVIQPAAAGDHFFPLSCNIFVILRQPNQLYHS